MFDSIKRLINWTGTEKKKNYLGFLYSFIKTMFVAMQIMVAALAIDLILRDMRGETTISYTEIGFLTAMIVVSVLGRFIFSYLRAKSQESVGYITAAQERLEIGNILKNVPLGFFEKNKTGELTSAVTTDLSFVEMLGMSQLDAIVNGLIMAIAMSLFMGFYSMEIAAIAIAGVLLSLLFLNLLGRKSNENAPVHQKAQDHMIGATIEYIRGMAIVKAFRQTGVSVEGIRSAYRESRDINIKIEKDYSVYNVFHLLVLKTASVGIVFVSAMLGMGGQMELPMAMMMMIFSFVIFGSVEAINNAMHTLKIIDATLKKLEPIKNARPIDEKGKTVNLSTFDIRFEGVSFAYGEQEVLHDVSLYVPQNTTTAIVGPSGSGKTTLCNLIARFYDVNKGRILVGGIDIKDMTCDSLLKNISMVFQKVYLFRDTIRNNISFGKPGATEQEIVDAAKKARCHDFIMALPDGYDTVIGDGGATLSGGEKQRISIARAMLKDAPIVILDEATASVDPENEHLIQQAISELTHGKTIIIIAHRLATIKNADQILVVDKGRIAQKGTHQQLINQEGIYKHFISIREQAEGWSID